MDGNAPSLHPTYPVLHALAPCMAVRDKDDARSRTRNYRASMDCCPSSWRIYFEVHASEMEREWN